MKKIILGIIGIVTICFLIPILLTNAKVPVSAGTEDTQDISGTTNEEVQTTQYEYSKYNTVKLLHVDTNNIEEIKLDEYLLGVVSA